MKQSVLAGKEVLRKKGVLRLTVVICLILSGVSVPRGALAQEKYPTKPINFIVGYPAADRLWPWPA